MNLVKLRNYQVEVEPELLLLKPFKVLYSKDKSSDKCSFYQFLTILYFCFDPRSDYSYIADDNDRLKEVCITNGIEQGKFSKEEKDCIELYKKLTTTTASGLLDSMKQAVAAIESELLETKSTLRSLEPKDRVAALKNITAMLSTVPELAKKVIETEKVVKREIEEASRMRGGDKNKAMFEDGF